VCHSIAGEIPTPGYHPEGMYEFKVDLNRDAVEELTYRLTFEPRDAAGKQRFVLRRVEGALANDPRAAGTVIAQATIGEKVTTSSGLRVWAGRAGDPLWIEPDVLHAVGHALQDGATLNLGDWTPTRAKNFFAWHTVYSMVLEVRDQDLLVDAGGDRRIGVWAVSTLASDAGRGAPLTVSAYPCCRLSSRSTMRIWAIASMPAALLLTLKTTAKQLSKRSLVR
jgi:hypothetical protein